MFTEYNGLPSSFPFPSFLGANRGNCAPQPFLVTILLPSVTKSLSSGQVLGRFQMLLLPSVHYRMRFGHKFYQFRQDIALSIRTHSDSYTEILDSMMIRTEGIPDIVRTLSGCLNILTE